MFGPVGAGFVLLRARQCKYIQGYYLARPMSLAEFSDGRWLHNGNIADLNGNGVYERDLFAKGNNSSEQ